MAIKSLIIVQASTSCKGILRQKMTDQLGLTD